MTKLTKDDAERYLAVAASAAQLGSRVLIEHLGKLADIRQKSSAGDLVTEADRRSEDCIIHYIKKQCPGHAILSEESGLHGNAKETFLWAVDPLDGTTNYTHQLPIVSVSIALIVEGEPAVGVVYNPFTDELFKAADGLGATLNSKSIAVSDTPDLPQSLLATGFAYDRRETPDNNYAEFCYLTSLTQGVRRMGSAALDLAYLAAGRFDGFWERGLNVWDIAAGIVLVKEAGGVVSSYENEPLVLDSGRILASNGLIHEKMSDALSTVHEQIGPIIITTK